MNAFPTEINAWKNDVARRLMALRGSVDGIFRTMPMLPDPEIGMAFSGPLSPVPFVFPPTINTGGTVGTLSTAANHCNQCSGLLRQYEITVSGITNRNCTLCAGVNGTFTLTAQDGTGSGSRAVANCIWMSDAITWCLDFGLPQRIWWYMWVTNGPGSGTTRTIVQLIKSSDYPDFVTFNGALLPQYRLETCPPTAGSGSGTVTMNRQSGGPFLNDCRDYPATITLRGIS